jgi:UDP:flavonoid glycosyltransferase YjiC (YdhE family)
MREAVRVLCCCPPLEGLIHPLFPLAAALVDAGHDVRIATGPSAHARVREMGLDPLPAGPSQFEAAAAAAQLPGLADLVPAEMWRLAVGMFASVIAPAQLRDLEHIVSDWSPDVVVCVPMTLAAPLVARTAGLPTVTQGFGLLPRPQMIQALAGAVAPLWQARGLGTPTTLDMFGSLYLDPVPVSLQADVAATHLARVVRMRLETPIPHSGTLPAWANQLGSRPVVYVSLGTVPPFSQPSLFAAILQGIERHDVDVVVTVGEQNQVSSLGPQPTNVHVERWLSLPLLLPRCTAAICHAGSGTMLAALAAGLPLLLLPQGADQFDNADACARAGVARVVSPDAFSLQSISAELAVLLSDRRYRVAAQRVRDEIAVMSSPADVVALVEELVRQDLPSARESAQSTLSIQA